MAPPQWCTFIPAWDVVHFYPGRTPGTTTNRTTKEDDTAAISWRTFIPAAGALDKRRLQATHGSIPRQPDGPDGHAVR